MPDRVGIGIIGCGGIGSYHAEVFSRLPGARLVAVADARADVARGVAGRLGCAWHVDYREMLARADVQAVTICTPSGLHAEMGIVAAGAGKHVLVEKPLDLDLARADELIRTCAQRGVQLGGVFQHRFNWAAHQLKAAVERGAFGRLLLGSVDVKWHRPQSYYDSAGWRGTRALDGGVLTNQAIHFVDQLCWLLGDVDRVLFVDLARVSRQIESEDLAVVVLQFRHGARGVLQATTAAYPGMPGRLELCGEKGTASLLTDVLSSFAVEGEPSPIDGSASPVPRGPDGGPTYGHEAQLLDFVAAVRENRPPLVDGQEARRAVHALSLIYEAAAAAGGRG